MSLYILQKAINLKKVVRTHPKLFNFSQLSIYEKIKLLEEDFDFYSSILNLDKMHVSSKITVLSEPYNEKIHKLCELSQNEINLLDSYDYARIVKLNIKKYFNKERFNKLNLTSKSEIFFSNPEWMFKTIESENFPKFTVDNLFFLSKRNQKLVDTYITDFSKLSTNGCFWINMIKYDKKYEDIFITNINSVITKTDIRAVCKEFPHIIKKLDIDILGNSKLSCKEWLLLANSVIYNNSEMFKDWEFNDDLKEAFKLDLTAEMLNGKSSVSRNTQSAMKKLLNGVPDE